MQTAPSGLCSPAKRAVNGYCGSLDHLKLQVHGAGETARVSQPRTSHHLWLRHLKRSLSRRSPKNMLHMTGHLRGHRVSGRKRLLQQSGIVFSPRPFSIERLYSKYEAGAVQQVRSRGSSKGGGKFTRTAGHIPRHARSLSGHMFLDLYPQTLCGLEEKEPNTRPPCVASALHFLHHPRGTFCPLQPSNFQRCRPLSSKRPRSNRGASGRACSRLFRQSPDEATATGRLRWSPGIWAQEVLGFGVLILMARPWWSWTQPKCQTSVPVNVY